MDDTSACVVTAQKPPPSRSTQHTGASCRSVAYSAKGSPPEYRAGSRRRLASTSDDDAVGSGIALRLEERVVGLEGVRTVGHRFDRSVLGQVQQRTLDDEAH